jgi:hypothetical protein
LLYTPLIHVVYGTGTAILEIRTWCESALAVSAMNWCQCPREIFVDPDSLGDNFHNVSHLPHIKVRFFVIPKTIICETHFHLVSFTNHFPL